MSIGIPKYYIIALMGLFVAAFAATTLDTSTRLQRYIITEIGKNYNWRILKNKYIATLFAVGTAFLLAFSSGGGKGAFALWPLFGAINQLLGCLALLIITVWLSKKNIRSIYTLIPMLFMLIITGWAMTYNISNAWLNNNYLLLIIGLIVMLFQFWIIYEGIHILIKQKQKVIKK